MQQLKIEKMMSLSRFHVVNLPEMVNGKMRKDIARRPTLGQSQATVVTSLDILKRDSVEKLNKQIGYDGAILGTG